MNANHASNTGTLALLDRLKTEMPEIWSEAQVVGQWAWLEFHVAREGLNALAGDFKSAAPAVITEAPPAVAQA